MNWEILNNKKPKDIKELIDVLLENRNIKNTESFFNPEHPEKITFKSLQIDASQVKLAVQRISESIKKEELIFIYGDYDADGICSTAILWESLHSLGAKVLPFIPDRFEDGYGIKAATVTQIHDKNPDVKLIITVDNGIVAHEGIKKAAELGIDTIILDHHTTGENLPPALAVIHTTLLSGSGIAWFFSRELLESRKLDTLELAAIGTVADQLPLVGANRSLVKYGIEDLNETKRPGLIALFEESGLTTAGMLIRKLGTYEIGFIIAPRINAMGRLKHGIESLRLLCTKDRQKARDIAHHIGSTNLDRQRIVEEVVVATRKNVTDQKIIVVSGETYHEGVIGLAAGRLVEEFYRPAIVISLKGEVGKASARSITGFNIIDAIRSLEGLYIEGGGHPMAAGFSIKTLNIPQFTDGINNLAAKLITEDLLIRRLSVDCKIDFKIIDFELVKKINEFEPVGYGNPRPLFAASGVQIEDAKTVGRDAKHLKLKIKQNGKIFDSIYFGGGEIYSKITPPTSADIVFQVEENVWNAHTSLQLKIKDLKLN